MSKPLTVDDFYNPHLQSFDCGIPKWHLRELEAYDEDLAVGRKPTPPPLTSRGWPLSRRAFLKWRASLP